MRKQVKLRDALFITHPKPQNDEQRDIFKKIASDTLAVPYTWEVELTRAGQLGKSKKEVWEELIDSGKVGYMAMLRNLRNLLGVGVSKSHIEKVCNRISDKAEVLKSKQLPFRYLSAWKSLCTRSGYDKIDFIDVPNIRMVISALEKAITHSAGNLDILKDSTMLVAADVSGSMFHGISLNSSVQYFDISALMAMMVGVTCKNSTVGMFGDSFKVIVPETDNILSSVGQLYRREGEVGYSTNGHEVIRYALDNNEYFDKIMIFTDCQMYEGRITGRTTRSLIDTHWAKYRVMYPEAKLYIFDLAGFGTTPVKMSGNGVCLVAGWSDKVFDVISRLEKGESALDEINSIEV